MEFSSPLGKFLPKNETISSRIIRDIDNKEDGKGDLVLIRIIKGLDGDLLCEYLKKFRDLLGFRDDLQVLSVEY